MLRFASDGPMPINISTDAVRWKFGFANLRFAGIRRFDRSISISGKGPEMHGITKNVEYRWKFDSRDLIVVEMSLFVKAFSAFNASMVAEVFFSGKRNFDAKSSVM